MVVWQLVPETGTRKISSSKLNSYQLEKKLLHIEVTEPVLEPELPLYCYSEDGQFIFKTGIKDFKKNTFSIHLPDEIHMLEDPDIAVIRGSIGVDLSTAWRVKRLNVDTDSKPDYMVVKSMKDRTSRDQEFLNNEFNSVSLDEEEKMYADKRESPRARPKQDKWVKLMGEVDNQVHLMKLFDLSQGGIGFITFEPHLFPKGSKIRVVGFENFDLDDPLVGQVMSHRQIDESQIEFKIGCKFDEGQD